MQKKLRTKINLQFIFELFNFVSIASQRGREGISHKKKTRRNKNFEITLVRRFYLVYSRSLLHCHRRQPFRFYIEFVFTSPSSLRASLTQRVGAPSAFHGDVTYIVKDRDGKREEFTKSTRNGKKTLVETVESS